MKLAHWYVQAIKTMITAVSFAIAAIPMAMYLAMLGVLRLRRQPFVTTGWRDVATLGIAVIGLVAIGPIQLFFPSYAAAHFSGWVWGLLLALYLLSLLLLVLSCRPRLIVYGISEDTFYQVLLAAAQRVDSEANWHGQILTLPSARLQLATEPTGALGVQQASSVSSLATVGPWLELERELVKQCAQTTAEVRSWTGLALLLLGLLLGTVAIASVMVDPAQASVDLKEFFIK